jgi:hypothetical protein
MLPDQSITKHWLSSSKPEPTTNSLFLMQDYPNNAFYTAMNEAIGLSMTPSYYQSVNLGINAPTKKAQLNKLMQMALENVSALPFNLAPRWSSTLRHCKVI